MKKMGYLIGLVILLSASECSKKEVSLAGTQWKVLELRQPNATNAQLPTKDYIVEFSADQSIGIKLDINTCFSKYEIKMPGNIAIQPLACTKACCDSELAMQIVAMLSNMNAFQVKKNKLSLEGVGTIKLVQVE